MYNSPTTNKTQHGMSGECEARERVEKSKSVLCICAASRLSDKSERGENGQTEIYSLIDSLSLSKSEEHAMTNLLFFLFFSLLGRTWKENESDTKRYRCTHRRETGGGRRRNQTGETKKDDFVLCLVSILAYSWLGVSFHFPSIWVSFETGQKRQTSHGGGGAWRRELLVLLVSIVGLLQRVPLGDGASGRGQHVGPMAQFGSSRVATEDGLSNGVGCADAIVIDDRDYQLHFLFNQSQRAD